MCFQDISTKDKKQGKIHYLGNAFPHNYADAWDDDRGMMILDKKMTRNLIILIGTIVRNTELLNYRDC